jgi:hypothetical protein
MPYPPYSAVFDFKQFYFIMLPQFLVLGFIFIVPSIIRNVVSEKETGIKVCPVPCNRFKIVK